MRWRKARSGFLAENPLCRYCSQQGRTTAATVVDHVIPHRGDMRIFWDESLWQALCKRCHDSIKAKEEHGKIVGCDTSGAPIDPLHPWG